MTPHSEAAEQNSNRKLLSTATSSHGFQTIKYKTLPESTPQNLQVMLYEEIHACDILKHSTSEASINHVCYTQYIGTTETPRQLTQSLRQTAHLSDPPLKLSIFLQVL